ncbi:MoaD/ThiS family protein [Nocardioides panacis]|uniref:MoaD/ThiS family protein n=1 Tax=Nocardioides panacis TaxID=2849501 RepID=A0A975SY90_9ACTN|nr:MoaD/ThiS family protein [Nocardioides panacis]QWZ08081.1 MoaD/ThiS family protein [Nocardioides panacis]
MSDRSDRSVSPESNVTVRYWAAARAAAGVESDEVAVSAGTTLADVLAAVRTLHADRDRLADVLSVCSVLVGDRPVGSREPGDVSVVAGDTVELLPPFAGG